MSENQEYIDFCADIMRMVGDKFPEKKNWVFVLGGVPTDTWVSCGHDIQTVVNDYAKYLSEGNFE